MIDVVRALELFEICADEMTAERASGDHRAGDAGDRRLTLTARALAKGKLNVAQLTRFPLRGFPGDGTAAREPTLTLGAMIVFRTADRCVRAGASPTRTLEALYRAVEHYLDILPGPLQSEVDKAAVQALITEAGPSSLGRRPRSATTLGRSSPTRRCVSPRG